MTNLAFQDIRGGSVHVYSANANMPKWDRIKLAFDELKHTGCIKIYLFKRNKLRKIITKGY